MAGKKKRKSSKEKIKVMLWNIVDDLYRHSVISQNLAGKYLKNIEEI